jgi:diaminohydroxyphosphoribosylaminopyrimidine deaminase/5-amino-6-(5-phosphoribosylamino)uracil reductase
LTDEFYIQRCIQLALKGKRFVAPNPMVGTVIVYNNTIIGEGYHEQYGQAHAEVNAIQSVKDTSLLPESTIYVSLEPCSHYGKTPPCSDLIIKHRFKRVVIGCIDTFSEVSGKGIEKLQQAGIEVTAGVLEEECRSLNKRFFTFHEQQRPYVILKWAQTQDGFIDKIRTSNAVGINWITQPETKKLVHQWRAEEQAILIGKRTAIHDNPCLTVREVEGNNPIRILLDSQLEVPKDSNLFSTEAPTLIFNTIQSAVRENIEWIKVDAITPTTVLEQLYKKNIQSVIIEGGTHTLESFIQSGLWDEARVLIGDTFFEQGVAAPKLNIQSVSETMLGRDKLLLFHRLDAVWK